MPEPNSDATKSRKDDNELISSIELLGDIPWYYSVPQYSQEEKTTLLDSLPDLRRRILGHIGIPPDELGSIAMVDWTSIFNTYDLMEGNTQDLADPFVALLDLSTIIRAIIFYDHIIFLDRSKMLTPKLNRLFGLDNVFCGISPHHLDLEWLLHEHLVSAVEELHQGTHMAVPSAPWIKWLEDKWKKLLPMANFPTHDKECCNKNIHYSTYPERPQSQFGIVFDRKHGEFTYRTKENYSELILDNDVRALFYEYLSRTFDSMIHDKVNPPIHYLGTCLRTLMLLARAEYAPKMLEVKEPLLEEVLQSEWEKLKLNQSTQYTMKLPFWMDAVLSDSNDTSSFAESAKELRKMGRKFRKSKSDLEKELQYGYSNKTKEMSSRLLDDEESLKQEMSPTEVVNEFANPVDEALKIFAGAQIPYAGFIKALSIIIPYVDKKWFDRIGLRLVRPQSWFVYSMGKRGRKIKRSTEKAFEIFSLKKGIVATEPEEFLKRFGELQWAT